MSPLRKWSINEIELLRNIFPNDATRNIIVHFPGKSYVAVKEKAKVLGLKKAKQYFHFTNEQLEIIEKLYPTTDTNQLATELGATVGELQRKTASMGLKKEKAYLSNMGSHLREYGKEYRFKEGNISFTKGKKQQDYMSAKGYEVCKSNYFKPGNIPANAKPVGYEVQDVDGYIRVKVLEPDVFKLKHRLVWENTFGAIPKGYNVQFRNKNRSDCTPENLYLISRRDQLLNENGIMAIPEELKPTYRILAKLKKTIDKYETNKP